MNHPIVEESFQFSVTCYFSWAHLQSGKCRIWDIPQVRLVLRQVAQAVARCLPACPFFAHCCPFSCPFFASTSAFQRCSHWLFPPLISHKILSSADLIRQRTYCCCCICCCCCRSLPRDKSNSQLCLTKKSSSPFSSGGAGELVPRARCRVELRPSASTRNNWPRLEGPRRLWPRIGVPAPSVPPLLGRTIRQTKNIRRRPNFPPNTDRKEPKRNVAEFSWISKAQERLPWY